jgi:2-dehydro-3-deoxyphosphogluconate aldolase/(4S)-4-hydroxy-2-oxoglutarate aldolase
MTNTIKPKFTLAHLGINSENAEAAKNVANLLSGIFGFETNEGPASIFAERSVEILKSQGPGRNGHIAFYTENADIAVKYLEGKGVEFNYESAKHNAEGELTIIYFKQEIGGFAIHLTSKK